MSTVEDKMDINQNNVDLCKYYKNNSNALKYDDYFFRDFKKIFLNYCIKEDNYCKILLNDESNLQYVKWMIDLMNFDKYKKEISLQVLLDIQKICNSICLFFVKIYIHIYIYLYALCRLYLSAFCIILKYLIKKYKYIILNKIEDINKIKKLSNIKKVKDIAKNVSNGILIHVTKCSYYDWYKIETNNQFKQNGKTHYYSNIIYPKLHTGILLVPTNNSYFVLNKNVNIKNNSKRVLILLMSHMMNYCQIDYIENVYVINEINNKNNFNKCEQTINNKRNSTIIIMCISKTNRNCIIVAYNINKKNYVCVKNICEFIEKQKRCYNMPSDYKIMHEKTYVNDNNKNVNFSNIKYYLKLDTKIKKEKKIKNSIFDFRENENQSSYVIYKIPNNLYKKREISKMYNIQCNIPYVYYFFATRQKNIVSEILYYSSCKNLTKGIYYEDFHFLFFLIKKLYNFRKPLLIICLNNFEVINLFISDSINVIYCCQAFIKKYILSKKYDIIGKRDVIITYYYIYFNLSKERDIYYTKINHILLSMLNGWICKKCVIKICDEGYMKICAECYIIITLLKLYAKYFCTFINSNFDFSGLLNCNINFINISNDDNINDIVNNSDNNNSINFHRSTNYSKSILRKKRGKNRHLHNLQKYVYLIIFYNIMLNVKNKPIKKINMLFSEKDSLYIIKKLNNYVKKKNIFILYYIYNNIDIFFIRVNFKSNIRRNIFFKIIIKYIKNGEKLKRYGEICFFSKIINLKFIQQKKAINTFFSISKKCYKFKYYSNLTKKKYIYIYFFLMLKCNEKLYSKYKSMNIIRNEFKEEKYIENSEHFFSNIFMKTCVKQCNNKENNDATAKKTGADKRNTKDSNDTETGSNGNNDHSGNDGDTGNNSGKDKNSNSNGDNNGDKKNDDKDKKNNRSNKDQDKERKKKNDVKKEAQKNSAGNTDKDETNKANDSNDNKNNENDEHKDDKENNENKENKEDKENDENKENKEDKENKEKKETSGNLENPCKKRKGEKGLTRNRSKGKNLNDNHANIVGQKTDEPCSINVDSPLLNVEKKDPVKRRKENKIDRKNYNHEKNEKYSLNMLIAENAHKIIKNGRVYKQFEPCHNHQTHNNFMLKELLWMSIDFYEEKRWKKNVSKRFSYLTNTNFYEKQKNDKHFISSQISNDIKMFWFFVLNEIRPDLVPIDLDHKVKNKNGIKKDLFRTIKKNMESEECNFKNITNCINLNTNQDELNSKEFGMVSKGERKGDENGKKDEDKNENNDQFVNSENDDTTPQKTNSGIFNRIFSLGILNKKNMTPSQTTPKNDSNSNDLNFLPKIDNNIIDEHCQNLDSNGNNEFENGLKSYEECLAKLENNVNQQMLNKYEYNSEICYNNSKDCNKINENSYKNTFYYNDEYSDYYDNNNDIKYNAGYNGVYNNYRYYNNHLGNNSYCNDCNYLDLSDRLYIYCLLFMSISLIEIKENIFYNIDNILNEDKVTILDEENDTHISKAAYSKTYPKDSLANEEQQTIAGEDNTKNGDIDQSNNNDINNNYMCNEGMEKHEENINCDGKDKMSIECKEKENNANEGNDGNDENINQSCEIVEKINENKILKMIKKESKHSIEHYSDKPYKEYKINQNEYHKNDNIYDNANDEDYKSNINYSSNNKSNNMLPFMPALSNIDVKELIVIPYSLPHDNIMNKETAYSLESEKKMYEWLNEIKERNINIYMNNMESYGGKSYPFELHNIDNYYNDINLPLTKLTEYDEYTFFLYLFYIKNSPYILKKQIQKDKKKRKRDLSDITPPKKRASRRKLNKESGEKEIEIARESEKASNITEEVDSKGISETNLLQTNNNSILIKGEENKNIYNNKLTSKHVGEIKKEEPQFSKDHTEKEIKLWKEKKLEWTNDEINFLLILANTYINYINIDTIPQLMDNKGTHITTNSNNNQNKFDNAENNNITIKNNIEVACSTAAIETIQKENKTLTNENDANKLSSISTETPNESKPENLENSQNIKMNNLNYSILSTEGNLGNTNMPTPHFKKNNESDKTIEDANYVYYINWTIISLALTSYNKINNICEITKSAEECRDKFLSLTKDNKYKNYNIYNLHENNYINSKNNIDIKKGSRKLKFLSIFSTTRTNTLIEAFNKYMNKKIEKYKLRKMTRIEKKMEHGQEVLRSKGETLNGDKPTDQTNYIIKTTDLGNSIFCDESEQNELSNNTLTEEMTQSNYKQTSISSNSSSKNDSMRSNIQNEISETLKDGSFFNDISLDTSMNKKEDFINNLFKDVSVNNYETSEDDAECGEDSFFSYSDVGYCSSGELDNNKSPIKLENMTNILDNLDNVEKLKIENKNLKIKKETHDDITEGRNENNYNCEFLDGDEKKIYNNTNEGEIENNINDNKPNCFSEVTNDSKTNIKKDSGIASNKIDDSYDDMEMQTNESDNYHANSNKMVNDVKSEIYKNDNDGCTLKIKYSENDIHPNNSESNNRSENSSYRSWKYSSNFTGSVSELICYDKIKKLLNAICKNKKNVNEFISLLKNEYIIKNPYFLKVIQIFINNVKPVIGYYDNMIDSVNGKSEYIYSNKEYLKDLCKNKIDKEFVKFIRKIIEHDKKQKNKYIEKIAKTIPYQNNVNSNELIIHSPSNSYNTVKNLSTKILNYVPYVDDKKKGNIKQMSKRFNSKNLVSQILLADYIVDKLKTFPINDSTSTYNNKTIDELISEFHLKAYTEYINDNFNENNYVSKIEKSYIDDPSTEINDESSINTNLIAKNKNVSDATKNNENELEGKFEISKKFSENFGHPLSHDQTSMKENSLYNKAIGDQTENNFNILPMLGNNTPNNKLVNNDSNSTIENIHESIANANLCVNYEKNIEMDEKTGSNMTFGIFDNNNNNNTNLNSDNITNNQGLKKLKKLNSEPSVNSYTDKTIDLGNYTKQIKNSSKTQPIRKNTGTTNKITKYKTSTNLCNYSNNKGRKNNNSNNIDNNVILNCGQNIKWPSSNKLEAPANLANTNAINDDYNNFYKDGPPVFEQPPISHEESNNKQHMYNEKINLIRKKQKASDNKCNNYIKNVTNESLNKYPSNQPYYQIKNAHDNYFNDNNQTPMKLNTHIPSTDINVNPSSAIMHEHIKGSDIPDIGNRADLLCNGSQPGNNVPLSIINSNSSNSNGINSTIGLNTSSHHNNMGGVIVGGINSSNNNHIINNFPHKSSEDGDKFVPFSYGALQNNKYVSPSQGNNQLYYNKAPIYESSDIASNKIGGNNTMNSCNSRSADISSNYFNSRLIHSLSNSNNISNVNLNADKNGYPTNMRDHIGMSRRSSTSVLYSETNENNENMIFMRSRSPSNYPSPYNPNKGIMHDNDSPKSYYDSQKLQQQMQHQTQQPAQQQSQVSNTDIVNNMAMGTNNGVANNKEESNNDPSNLSEAKNKNVMYHNYALNKYPSNNVKKLSQINNQNGSNIQPGYHNINYDQINNNYIPQNLIKNHNELVSSNNDKTKMLYYPTHPIPNFANINNVPFENLDKHHVAFPNDSFNRNINYLNQMNLAKMDAMPEKENMSTGVKIIGEKAQHTQQSIKNNTQHSDMHNPIVENNLGQSNYPVNMINGGSLSSSSNAIIEGTPKNDTNADANNHHNLSPIPSNSMQQSQINIDQNNNYIPNGHERDPASRMQFTTKGSAMPAANQQNININNQGIKYNDVNSQNINQPSNLNSYINQVNFIVQVLNKKKGNQKDNIPPNINQQTMGKYNVDQAVANNLNLKHGNFANPNLSQPHNNNVIQNGNNNNNSNMGLSTYHTPSNINLQNIKSPINDSSIPSMLNMGMRNSISKNIMPNIPPNNVFAAKDVIQQKMLQQQQQHKMQQELIHKAHNDKDNPVNPQIQFSEEQMQHQKLLQKMKQEQLQKPLQQIHPHQIQAHNMNSQQQVPIHPMQQKMQALQIQSLLKAQQMKKQLHPSQLQQQQLQNQQIQQKLHPQQIHPQQLRSPQLPQQQLTLQQMQQMKMHNMQLQNHEMKKHMEQLQKKMPYNQQKLHQIYNLQQNIISNDEKNDKKNIHRQISMGINPQIQNMHMLQAKNNDELISKESLNNNLNENPLYAVNRKFSNNLNKFKNPDNFFPQNSFHSTPSSNKMDVKDIRNIGNKALIENNIVLNPSQKRTDIPNNNINPHILPINMASYNSQNMQCKININKNNSNSQENNNC